MKSLKDRVDAAIAELWAMSPEEFRAVFEDADAEAEEDVDTDPAGSSECPPKKKPDRIRANPDPDS